MTHKVSDETESKDNISFGFQTTLRRRTKNGTTNQKIKQWSTEVYF